MIKGVNKQIFEVSETGSGYFEKVLLVVSRDGSRVNPSILSREAERVVSAFELPKSRMKKKRLIPFGLTAAASAVLTGVAVKLFT